MINIVIPMAGLGSRFSQAGYAKPKPFIDVAGMPMICRVMEHMPFDDARFILIARQEHLKVEADTVRWIGERFNATFIGVDKLTEGTVCTVLYAHDLIDNDTPLLIANSDQFVEMDLNNYVRDCFDRKLDGSILTFEDKFLDPKWSFAKIDEAGLVTETQEKKAISPWATVGFYFFSKGKYFVESALDMIVRNERVNNEFYVCPVYNHSIRRGLKIGIYNIEEEAMKCLGTPQDLDAYLQGLPAAQ